MSLGLRQPKDRILWVHGHQVSIMPLIYKNAKKVIAWLGLGVVDSSPPSGPRETFGSLFLRKTAWQGVWPRM